MLFYYAKANQMINHNFNDDVAIVFAKSKEEAFNKFLEYYGNATLNDVKRIYIKRLNKVNILTDY